MTEDKFDQFLREHAESYNAPPARTPREEMWQALQTTRRAGPRVVYGGGASPAASTSRFGWKVWLAAAAAVVLVASGIGIGRWTASSNSATAAGNQQAPTDRASTADSATNSGSGDQPARLAEGGTSEPVRGGGRNGRAEMPSGTISAGTITPGASRSAGAANSMGSSAMSAYQVAAVNHLTQAEALLTSFRTRSMTDQRMDAQLASWARELLSNTRLLLDSPVAVDPERRPLLEDLELLLVQIVQLSPGSTPQDREIMEQTLKQDQVFTRLRTAIPAGQRGS